MIPARKHDHLHPYQYHPQTHVRWHMVECEYENPCLLTLHVVSGISEWDFAMMMDVMHDRMNQGWTPVSVTSTCCALVRHGATRGAMDV